MKAILSADKNWGIGYKGELLKRVPEDMKFFKKMTIDNVVVMGRETFESLPGRQPLKERVNIVLSKNACYKEEGLVLCRSMKELFRELRKYPTENIYIIGGETIYNQLLPYCSQAYVTKFEKEFVADRHFPDLDALTNWVLAEESQDHYYKDLKYRFLNYINNSIIPMPME